MSSTITANLESPKASRSINFLILKLIQKRGNVIKDQSNSQTNFIMNGKKLNEFLVSMQEVVDPGRKL